MKWVKCDSVLVNLSQTEMMVMHSKEIIFYFPDGTYMNVGIRQEGVTLPKFCVTEEELHNLKTCLIETTETQ